MENNSGLEAIQEHIKNIYPNIDAKVLKELNFADAPKTYIENIVFYEIDEPIPHWMYVSHGLSELHEKKSPYPEMSGYGFELVFRLKKQKGEKTAPLWAKIFMNNLANIVYESREGFFDYNFIHANGPICLDEKTDLVATTFITDPILKEISTPNGNVNFLEIVPLTEEEYAEIQDVNYDKLVEKILEKYPLYITDIKRKSLI